MAFDQFWKWGAAMGREGLKDYRRNQIAAVIDVSVYCLGLGLRREK